MVSNWRRIAFEKGFKYPGVHLAAQLQGSTVFWVTDLPWRWPGWHTWVYTPPGLAYDLYGAPDITPHFPYGRAIIPQLDK